MTTLREAAQLALEALESLFTLQVDYNRPKQCGDAITALRAALEQPEQEPVAWFVEGSTYHSHEVALKMNGNVQQGILPLYAHPPRREWRGLTDEEAKDIAYEVDANGGYVIDFYRAVEAKLKELNHD